ncbi:MAG: hypothetical protein HY553_18740 [Elusimicrobia bacterium]|nr:hypothetical protein [Elusimicrobiota bacterium]
MELPTLPGQRDPESANRRLWRALGAVVAGALLLGFLTLGLRKARSSGEAAARGFAIGLPAQPGGTRLTLPAQPPPGEKPLAFDEFMGLLDGLKHDPLAAEFARELMKDPELAKIVRKYQQPGVGDKPGSMVAFYRELAERPEFRALVARFAGQPGADALMVRLNQLPGLKQLVRGEAAPAGAPAAAGSASARPSFRSATQLGTGLRHGAGPVQSAGAGPSAGAFAARGAGPGGFGAAGAGAEGTAQIEAGAPGRAGDRPPGAGSAHDANPLATLDGAGPSTTRDSFMSLCIKQSNISRSECEAINANLGPFGIWEACWLASLYDKCVGLCASVPELQCSGRAPGWTEACIAAAPGEADRAATCYGLCQAAGRSDCGPAPTDTDTGTTTGTSAGGTYTIRPGDNMTRIVMNVYGITDPRTAYLTALELYRYGENRRASGTNPYNPNLIFPGRVLTLPPLPELGGMTITRP